MKPIIGAQVERLETVDSTSSYLRRKAAQGAPHGLAVIAREQTGGRGRFGRSFHSAPGLGLYLSVLLRPSFPAALAPMLTPWTAVAVCRAVEGLTGLRPQIKWINDVLLGEKKLCGILTEGDIAPDGSLNWVILGIGVNISQRPEDLPPEVAGLATSLAQHLPTPPDRDALADTLLRELDRMYAAFPREKEDYLAAYRARCSTPGRPVRVLSAGESREGFALEINEDFALTVRFPDGSVKSLDSGEVSVRNLP